MESVRRTFTIDHCLGRGGFGEVYRAEMSSTGGLSTQVAVKVLRRDLAPGGQAMQRLKDEGLLLARLNHPTILRVHDLVVLEGRVSLVTEFVDGEDLERCLRGSRRLGPRALVEVIGQVASALDAAFNAPIGEHGAPLKLVHRDIKPSNIRISRHGEVKLLDFGIARSDEVDREARTLTDMMVGSPPYMAPERFLDAELRSASDVFGLGAIVLEGLIGRRVFDQPVTVLATLAVDRGRYDAFVEARIAEVPDDAPPEIVALARETLTYAPDDRPTAAALARRCEALVDVVEGPGLTRWCRERRWKEPARPTGDLDGRVVTEGTLARQTTPIPRASTHEASAPAEPAVLQGPATGSLSPGSLPPAVPTTGSRTAGTRIGTARDGRTTTSTTRSRGMAVWIGGASVLSTGLALGGLATLVAAAVALWAAWPVPRPAVAPIVVPAPTPAPTPPVPVAPIVVAPEPVPEVPTAPEQDRGRKPSVRPPVPPAPPVPAPVVPVAPPPAPTPPAPTPAPARARVTVTGAASDVHVVRGAERIPLPGTVPAGTWELRATIDGIAAPPLDLVVSGEEAIAVDCLARMRRCVVR